MLEVQKVYARKLLGQSVRVACTGGGIVDGRLLSFNGHSLWLVQDDADEFVSIHDVVGIVARAGRAA